MRQEVETVPARRRSQGQASIDCWRRFRKPLPMLLYIPDRPYQLPAPWRLQGHPHRLRRGFLRIPKYRSCPTDGSQRQPETARAETGPPFEERNRTATDCESFPSLFQQIGKVEARKGTGARREAQTGLRTAGSRVP